MAARAGHAPLPTGARRKATEGVAVVGWAGFAQLGCYRDGQVGQVSPSSLSFFYLCFSISIICFDLI